MSASVDVVLCVDAKEIDPSDIEMKERLGAGQFGVSLFTNLSDDFCNLTHALSFPV